MCTSVRFSDDQGHYYLGRNLDWSFDYGENVVITPTGYTYHSAFLGDLTPKYPVIGMAIIQENVPLYFDCANNAGLAIAGLNFPGYAQYEEAPVEGKTNISAYEFPYWVAMNFSTVDETEEALKNVAIINKPINEKFPCSLLHWIIGDANRSIVIEYTDKGMEIFHNDVDVMANQPGYAWHHENLRNYMNLSSACPESVTWDKAELKPFGSGSCMRGLPGDCYSPSRFVRIAYHNANYPVKSTEAENVTRMFKTLGAVAMVDGAGIMADGKYEITTYTGGFSSATNTYYYNTYDNPTIKSVAMADHDLTSAELIEVQK